jgi:hypothetical protein
MRMASSGVSIEAGLGQRPGREVGRMYEAARVEEMTAGGGNWKAGEQQQEV